VTSDRSASLRPLVWLAAISGIYDALLGLTMIAGRDVLARVFATPPPTPPIHADLNGLFLIAVAIGYLLPYRRPDAYRGYLWVMGPFLKGAGAAAFVLDHLVRHSPPAYLLFAATDGSLAVLTLWVLLATRAEGSRRADAREAQAGRAQG
jgi:hypothetical protein